MASTHPKLPWYTAFYRRGHLLALSIVIVLVAGLSALSNLPRLEDPRIDTRNALVITPYPGASADRVEALVTDVIEDKLREIYEIKEIKSTSRADISVISIELQDWVNNSNNESLFSEIRDAIADASTDFPTGAGTPLLDEKRGATAFTLLIGIKPSFADQTPMTMVGRLADELADRLRNVPGTELVRIYGDPEEEINVSIDPSQLTRSGLTLGQISQIIQRADPKLPAGVVHTDTHDIRIQVGDTLDNLSVIQNIPLINQQGAYLRLGDIAEVSRGFRQPQSDMGMVNGEPVIFVAARMQTTVRVDKWTESAIDVVNDFNALFDNTVDADVIFEQNVYTDARLSELTQNLLMGSLVVMAVILIFMGMRASWIVGLALPMCAAFALFSLSFFSEQIHQMSIFGIIIAIGLLIDNAIVITDEIRLNLQNRELTRGQALSKSIKHLFAPLLASTLTTILGFMPIFLLNGNIGDFVGPIAISVVMALIGSLFISLTIIGALAARFLPRGETSAEHAWYARGIQMPSVTLMFRKYLAVWITKPFLVLPTVVVICLSGFVLSSQLANVFFPSADRDQFEIYVWTGDGSSINQTRNVTLEIDQAIRNYKGVEQVTWLIGGSAPSVYYNQIMKRDNSPNFANGVISTDTVEHAAGLIGTLQTELQATFPNVQIVVRAFGQGPPIDAPVEVDIIGPDLATLDRLGQDVRRAMSQVSGISQSTASITMGNPELVVDTTSDNTSLGAFSLSDVADQMQVNLSGLAGGSVLESTEEIPVRVRLNEQSRDSLTALGAIPLLNQTVVADGQWMPLAAVSEFDLRPSLSGITRQDGERINRIQAYLFPGVPAVDASSAVRDALEKDGFDVPPGYRIKMAGDADEQKQAMGQLGTYAPVLLVMMITTLILTFSSIRMATVIGMVAILSVGLGMFSLWLSGLPIGFNPLLGSAGLIGVAINGSIVVIAAINANPQAKLGDTQAIIEETLSCSRHILSTTFTTVGGLIPLLLFSEGSFWPPLAVVLAGGVGFSVILSLIFTPTIVAALARLRAKKIARLGECIPA